jgi:hypothetical protein
VKALRTRRLLLLTATPFENRIDDLFQLVNLVRPGLLGTPATFRRRYSAVEGGAAGDAREALQKSLRDVMVRHRRSEVALMLPRRLAETLAIPPALDEAVLYRAVGDRVREAAREASPAQRLTLRHMQRAALEAAAARALASGDSGLGYLAWPRSVPPSRATLLADARNAIAVDHGRIDPGRDPIPVYYPFLRVGALVTYTLDDRFTERVEVWIDAPSGGQIDDRLRAQIGAQAVHPRNESRARTLPIEIAPAAASAHTAVQARAMARARTLAQQAGGALRDELARADAYYDAALASIVKRRAAASEGRRGTLDAQADAVERERLRRVQEIEAKFRPTWEIAPFRLHIVHVSALALEVEVRRGDSRHDLLLHWLLSAARFAPPRCPACGAHDALVVTRTRLGCRRCSIAGAVAR